MSSTSSARVPAAKIEISCDCGKRYRVPARKAGKKITCKACGESVRIPKPKKPDVSQRSRQQILAELGIDPMAAEEAYKAEVARRTKKSKAYHCTRCSQELVESELKGAYVEGELVCSSCRASAEVSDRKAEREAEEKKRKGPAAVELTTAPDPQKALAAALGYGALFLVGIAGPLYFVADLGGLASFGLGLVVAGIGAATVYRTRTA